jgi:hypothetical protein
MMKLATNAKKLMVPNFIKIIENTNTIINSNPSNSSSSKTFELQIQRRHELLKAKNVETLLYFEVLK